MTQQPRTPTGQALSLRRAMQSGVNLLDAAAMAVINRDILAIEADLVAQIEDGLDGLTTVPWPDGRPGPALVALVQVRDVVRAALSEKP